MSDNFKFVIVGTGNIAQSYVKAIGNIPDAEIVACISRGNRRPRGAPGDLPIRRELYQVDMDYDAVILAVPNGMHRDYAIEAAELGKHVLSEKCLEVSYGAMDDMIATCERCGVKLAVAYQKRMYPHNCAMKFLLERGVAGKVFAVELDIKYFRTQAYYDSAPYRGTWDIDGGGAFIQQAAHDMDLLGWFFGTPVKTVSMLGTFMHNMEAEDHGVAILRYADGMIATITASTCISPGYPAEMRIYTDKGNILLKNDSIAEWNIDGVEPPRVESDLEIHSAASSAAVHATAGHELIIRDFIDAVRSDREPAVSGQEARRASDIVLDIYTNNIR
ncbi:MAG: Gfo/Idh/MocA family oxidoreductase [Victivallales bacterium]|nr:Gfo/Idh/MocA family oxidoreductase [Victivallales bacterium]